MEPGAFTKNEIISQPEAWSEALQKTNQIAPQFRSLLAADYQQVIFTGCGSTYYLSLAAASLFQKMTGRIARAVPASELLFNSDSVLSQGKTLLVSVSRSGSTSETVCAVEKFKEQKKGTVVAITNYGDQPLAKLADLVIEIEKGQEKSVAQTRSFASMFVAATALAMHAAGQTQLIDAMKKLPEVGATLIQKFGSTAEEIGKDLSFDRFYFLGSGARYGLACEANLKMKEMSLTHSEPFHFMEFRHGPMSMVTKSTLMVGLLSEENRLQETKVMDEMVDLGATLLTLAESDARISFSSTLPAPVRNVLYLPILQLISYHRSLAKGLNPDQPSNLTAVVTLNLK
jgi:glutamine---fructose-6-phosphate transaminase (isomerizing)